MQHVWCGYMVLLLISRTESRHVQSDIDAAHTHMSAAATTSDLTLSLNSTMYSPDIGVPVDGAFHQAREEIGAWSTHGMRMTNHAHDHAQDHPSQSTTCC